jgi:RNA polymerase sigma-70 factor, ECF subfamily
MSDQDPFSTLISATKPLVLSAVHRYFRRAGDVDVEDMMQDVYLRLYTHWRAGKLATVSNPEAYIYTMAKHACLNKNRRRETLNIDDVTEPSTREVVLSAEDHLVLRDAIRSVPEKYSLVLKLVLAGYTPSELVYGLKMPLNTIKSLVLRGKQKLKHALEKEGYHDYP